LLLTLSPHKAANLQRYSLLYSFVKTGVEPKPVCVSDYALNPIFGFVRRCWQICE